MKIPGNNLPFAPPPSLDLSSMGREELERLASELLKRVDELLNPPPNDWHSWFFAMLHIALHRFYPSVRIDREVPLGALPPRADFLIIRYDERLDLGLRIFKIFRKYNILEFKSPDDELSENVLWKTIGYAGFYIANAPEKIPSDEVTISLFRAAKPKKFLKEMEGYVTADKRAGIYHIKGWMAAFPIQVVVTSELDGEEYAGFRAISKTPDADDIYNVLSRGERETDEFVKKQYHTYFDMLSKLDLEQVEEIKRRYPSMARTWMDVFKPEIDERIGISRRNDLFKYVQNGDMALENAARYAKMTSEEFKAAMLQGGYRVPQFA